MTSSNSWNIEEDTLARLLSWLNTRLSSATGFKVAPTFPLEKRIERFVVGEGMQV